MLYEAQRAVAGGIRRNGRCDSPVLIIGTERSGSNLLRLVLDSHSAIAIPHPPHFMRYLAPIASAYGDLTDERNRRLLVRDACLLLEHQISPWPHRIDQELAVAHASPTVFGVVAEMYEQYRVAEGKPRWGCKSTFMVDHVDQVVAEYPAARFIWLVRDPRDVASSARDAVFGHYHPYLTAQLWETQQRRAASAVKRFGSSTVRLVRYEDLVSDPVTTITGICEWLGETSEPTMFEHHLTFAAQRFASLCDSWRRTGGPVTAASVGSYRRRLKPTEIAQVDTVARALMTGLGYQPACPQDIPPPGWLATHLREGLLRARVEYRSLRRDRNAVMRWRRQAVVRFIRIRARLRSHWRHRDRSRTMSHEGPTAPRSRMLRGQDIS